MLMMLCWVWSETKQMPQAFSTWLQLVECPFADVEAWLVDSCFGVANFVRRVRDFLATRLELRRDFGRGWPKKPQYYVINTRLGFAPPRYRLSALYHSSCTRAACCGRPRGPVDIFCVCDGALLVFCWLWPGLAVRLETDSCMDHGAFMQEDGSSMGFGHIPHTVAAGILRGQAVSTKGSASG